MGSEMLLKLSESKGIALSEKKAEILAYPDFQLDADFNH